MKTRPRVRRYVTFTTEVEGVWIHHRLSYWQFIFRFVALPAIVIGLVLFVKAHFFPGEK